MNTQDNYLGKVKKCIVKIGSALLTCDGKGLDKPAIAQWAAQIAAIKARGIEVVLVSSGSVAEGMNRMGWKKRPTALFELQAAAAIGQAGLIQTYQDCFDKYPLQTAQILLTHDDLSNRTRYLNARSTLNTLLKLNVLPIVNENDTVAFDEIRFGDNDTLGALVGNLIGADLLIILTDQKGLYNKDPRQFPEATLIKQDHALNPQLLEFAGSAGTLVGTGGMKTKVLAAQRAARSGCATIIASGREENVLTRLFAGESLGSLLIPNHEPLLARKQWLASQIKSRGILVLDSGAQQALLKSGRSLLPVGVTEVFGEFIRGDVVECHAIDGDVLAKGLVNYSSTEARKIRGIGSSHIIEELGYIDEPELIHRDNMVILKVTET